MYQTKEKSVKQLREDFDIGEYPKWFVVIVLSVCQYPLSIETYQDHIYDFVDSNEIIKSY